MFFFFRQLDCKDNFENGVSTIPVCPSYDGAIRSFRTGGDGKLFYLFYHTFYTHVYMYILCKKYIVVTCDSGRQTRKRSQYRHETVKRVSGKIQRKIRVTF